MRKARAPWGTETLDHSPSQNTIAAAGCVLTTIAQTIVIVAASLSLLSSGATSANSVEVLAQFNAAEALWKRALSLNGVPDALSGCE